MHSRIGKLMVAATVMIVVVTGLVRMGEKDKGVALGALIESMHKMRWVHATGTVTRSGQVQKQEEWECFDPNIRIEIRPDGVIDYRDYGAGVAYFYEPHSNTVRIGSITDRPSTPVPDSPAAAMEMMIASWEKEGGQIRRESTTFEGILAQKIYVTTEHQEITLICDPDKKLPLAIDMTIIVPETGERQTIHGVYEFPVQGPADIYSLDVPRDAKVVDNRLQGDLRELMDQVRKRFDGGFDDHIALVLESEMGDANELEPLRITITHQSGQLMRMDTYRARELTGGGGNTPTLYPAIKNLWPNLTIAGTIAMEDRRFAEQQAVYDGTTLTQRTTNSSGQVSVQTIPTNLFVMGQFGDSIASLAWPNTKTLMATSVNQQVKCEILPQDSNHPGWVGFRLVKTTENPSGPSREMAKLSRTESYWFDPARDYILMKSIVRGGGMITERTTLDAAQMPGGKWYPRVLRIELYPPSTGGRIHHLVLEKRIQVDTSPVFDQALFKADSLR